MILIPTLVRAPRLIKEKGKSGSIIASMLAIYVYLLVMVFVLFAYRIDISGPVLSVRFALSSSERAISKWVAPESRCGPAASSDNP